MALQMTWQQPRRKPPLGLKNLGNTCYLNSVLQCLSYTPPLAQFCLSSSHSSFCKAAATAGRERECPFCILERQIARCLSLDGPLDAPSKIQKCITVFAEHFRLGRQEDAHEFLRYVIDACHDTCLKLLKLLPGSDAGKAGAASGASSVMKEIFGGVLLNQVKCLSCKGESNKTDEIMDISLDVFQSNSLKEALGRFFQSELLDGANKYNCSTCKKLSVARKQMFVLRAPNVLVVQLKRFEGINGAKINRNIEFEEVLFLSKFMCNSSQDPQPEYNLFGSIVHAGYSPDSGHYYAYIKDASGRWYCCNDALVSLSSLQEVLSEKVYILFYIRSNQSPRSIKSCLPNGKKSALHNGSIASSCQKSVEQKSAGLWKKPSIKQNATFSSKNNVSSTVKNGEVLPNPQIKPFGWKKFDKGGGATNGNCNLEVNHDVHGKRSNGLEKEQVGDKSKIFPSSSCMSEPKAAQKLEMSSTPKHSGSNGTVPSAFDKKQMSSASDGSGSVNQIKFVVHEDNGTQKVAATGPEVNSDNSTANIADRSNSSISGLKRKSVDSERAEIPVLSGKKSCSMSRKHVSYQSDNEFHKKHHPGGLEKFVEVLAEMARSNLQLCGWADKVHDFMSMQKKKLMQVVDEDRDETKLRKQLVSDAKKAFVSQIPESLKEHLIEHLRKQLFGAPNM